MCIRDRFSIVEYESEGGNKNIGHGLDKAPEFMIVKALDHAIDWAVYHVSAGNTGILKLNKADIFTPSAGAWNNTTPNNQTFRVGGTSFTNGSGSEQGDYIAYCWHSVPGYSAFGSYTGNSDSNGPFVALSFRPAFLLLKRTNDFNEHWILVDSTRSVNNPCAQNLFPDRDVAENTDIGTAWVDFLSNGFELRADIGPFNAGSNYIYAAFAENPFGGSNTSPANAR